MTDRHRYVLLECGRCGFIGSEDSLENAKRLGYEHQMNMHPPPSVTVSWIEPSIPIPARGENPDL
jgi:hypothetical protein